MMNDENHDQNLIDSINARLLSSGFDKAVIKDTIIYCKDICEFRIWHVKSKYYYYVKLIPDSGSDIFLMASNNNSYYKYRNITLGEILDTLCSCGDINKLDMYMENRDNLNALEVLACR